MRAGMLDGWEKGLEKCKRTVSMNSRGTVDQAKKPGTPIHVPFFSINKLQCWSSYFFVAPWSQARLSGGIVARRYLRFDGRFIIELIFRAPDWINFRYACYATGPLAVRCFLPFASFVSAPSCLLNRRLLPLHRTAASS